MNAENIVKHPPSVRDLNTWPVPLQPASMCGLHAWWSVIPNHSELRRRSGAEVDVLQRLDVTSTLLSLPIDVPVAEDALLPTELRALAGLSQRLVERVDGHVVRRTSPPLQVDHVAVRARVFRRGLEAATEFATYCAGSIVLPAAASVTELELSEASYYGVGVYLANRDDLVCLAEPDAFPVWPESAASWVFSEILWRRLEPPT